MVTQSIKDIDIKKLKKAKGVMAVLELLGITEEDLLLLKKIPDLREENRQLKDEIASLKEDRDKILKTIDVQGNKSDSKSSFVGVVNSQPKEFNPHYEQDRRE